MVLGGIAKSCFSYNEIKRPHELETHEPCNFNVVHDLIAH